MLSKEECLRLKGISEPLEDIIVRHFGKDWKKKVPTVWNNLANNKYSEEDELLINLYIALINVNKIYNHGWYLLLHKNDKLDTGDK